MAEEKPEQSFIALPSMPEDVRKRLHRQALEKIVQLFNYLNQYLSVGTNLEALKFYIANKDDKGLVWLYPDTSQALRPFLDLDLENNDFQLKVLFAQLDLDIWNFRVKWLKFNVKAQSLYRDECIRQAEDNIKRLAALDKEAKEEARKREEQARKEEYKRNFRLAHKALDTPVHYARKHLEDEEYEKYLISINGAVLAYMEKGEQYKDDSRSADYCYWSWLINYREAREREQIAADQEKERQQVAADFAAREFNTSLSKHIAGLESKLSNKRRDLRSYFTAKIQDTRYIGHSFNYVLGDEDERNFDRSLVSIANDKLKQIIPPDLLEFIEIPSTYYRLYFPLPSISYIFKGVQCLVFNFEVFVAAYAEVLLKPKVKTFGIRSFNLPAEKEGNVLIPLEKPKLLGYFYLILTPEELGSFLPWQPIPLVLLNWLLKGGTEPQGITVSAVSDGTITYKVSKFKEEVTIPDSFASYLRDCGSIDEVLDKGSVNDKIANIVKTELGKLTVERKLSTLEEKVKRKDTKKEQAFELFRQGKGPTSPEVKALGMHKSTRFKYHKQYLALLPAV